jgi:hypothetical protein
MSLCGLPDSITRKISNFVFQGRSTFDLRLFSWPNWILEESSLFFEKMSSKTEYAYCSLRDRQSELMIFVSAIAYRPTSLPLVPIFYRQSTGKQSAIRQDVRFDI